MGRRTGVLQASPPVDLVEAVATEAAGRAATWFPELEHGPVRTRVVAGQARARCFLYRLALDDGVARRLVVVKVRHSRPQLRMRDQHQDRPVLAPERTMPDRETARLEYEGLSRIVEAFSTPDPRFGLLRPLAWIPDHAAIVMDLVEQPTLRTAALAASRLHPRRSRPVDEAAWRNVGAWLRTFQDRVPSAGLPARVESAAEVAGRYGDYADFLRGRVGPSPLLATLRASAHELAEAALPTHLPLRTGHGDFVAHNMFVAPDSRITVFDPLPRWRVPAYQDLATLTVGLRVVPAQATSQGFALPRHDLDRYEAALLQGYFGNEPVPLAAVRAFQLLVLLDRWAAMVSKQVTRGGVRPLVRVARVRLGSMHHRREAERLHRELVGLSG